MKICGIYGILHTVDNKWYIGQSIDIMKRKKMHFAALRRNKHENPYLQHAFNKHGEHCFKFHILAEVLEPVLDHCERAWILFTNSNNRDYGYNSESGGSLRKRHSEYTKQKMSNSAKLRPPVSEVARQRMSAASKQRVRGRTPEETKKKISESLLHHAVSDFTRNKMSTSQKTSVKCVTRLAKLHESNIGKKFSEDHRRKIGLAQKGRNKGIPLSIEHRLKLSIAGRGRIASDSTRQKRSKNALKQWEEWRGKKETIC